VRLALGAGPARLVRQLLTESVLLALLGGALGLMVAYTSKSALLALRPWGNETRLDLPLDGRVFVFTLVVSVATGIIFGLVPALRGTRMTPNPTLKHAAGAALGARTRLSKALVAVQVGLSLLLLLTAGLFIRTLANLNRVALGFDADNVLVFRVNPRMSGYREEKITPLLARLLERMQAVPGVRAAALSRMPLLSFGARTTSIAWDGSRPDITLTYTNIVSASFLATTRIPIVTGRDFSEHDDAKAPRVAVINETMARRFFPEGKVLGRHFWYSNTPEDRIEIVGIARDAKYRDVRSDIPPTAYVSYLQEPITQANFELRTAVPPLSLVNAVRAAAHDVDPNLPLFEIKTQRDYADMTLSQERLFARFSGAFAAIALALAAIGLYGVMSYGVERRSGEIGIRMALGAQPRAVLWMVLRESLLLVALGGVIGGAASLGAFRLAKRQLVEMLYGVEVHDPISTSIVLGVLLAAALTAAYWPARRAASVDPMVALRHE